MRTVPLQCNVQCNSSNIAIRITISHLTLNCKFNYLLLILFVLPAWILFQTGLLRKGFELESFPTEKVSRSFQVPWRGRLHSHKSTAKLMSLLSPCGRRELAVYFRQESVLVSLLHSLEALQRVANIRPVKQDDSGGPVSYRLYDIDSIEALFYATDKIILVKINGRRPRF